MSNVVDLKDYKAKKKAKADKQKQASKPQTVHQGYTGKLAEAMKRYGSSTGNVMKDQYKKKEELKQED